MDSTTQPQQLSFLFDAPQTSYSDVTSLPSSLDFSSKTMANMAVVYDFKSAVDKREASTHALLYRQILESVRHIG